jgi:hypothetical protein
MQAWNGSVDDSALRDLEADNIVKKGSVHNSVNQVRELAEALQSECMNCSFKTYNVTKVL